MATPTTTPVLNCSYTDSLFGGYLNRFNGVLYATDYTGADMGAKIAAALTAAYAAGGGTVDARGFVCPTSCHIGTANLTVGDNIHPVTLLWPLGTITRDTIVATGKSAQIIYNSDATVIGQGPGVTIISGPSDVTAVQQGSTSPVTNVHLSGFSISDTGTVQSGSVTLMVGGKNPDGTTGADVSGSTFSDLITGGADIGTLIDSQHGCICYVKFDRVDSSGATTGIKTKNDSGYAFGVNSNQWTQGRIGGAIGLWDTGTMMFTWSYLDFESNASSTGAILYSGPDGNNAGTGYNVGDTVRPTGGDSTAVLTVASVSSGAVTGLTVTTPGTTYTNVQSVATTALTGSGTGLKVDLRVSAYMLLLSTGGDYVINPYEEAGGGDYICGTGNYVAGSFFSTNGATYLPAYCTGSSGVYGGPASNFVWGPGAPPNSMGVGSYIFFGGHNYYDDGNVPGAIALYADGPNEALIQGTIYGYSGHGDWKVGLSEPFSGVADSGRISTAQLSAPTPTVAVGAGSGTTSYTYGMVCHDANSGATAPGTFSSPVNGPSALGAWLTATPVAGGTGYVVNDVVTVTGGSGTAQLTVNSVGAGGAVTGLSVTTPGSAYRTVIRSGYGDSSTFTTTGGTGTGLTVTGTSSYMSIAYTLPDGCRTFDVLRGDSAHAIDQTGSTVGWKNRSMGVYDFGSTIAYTAPTRNSTGDASIAGTLAVGGGSNILYRCSGGTNANNLTMSSAGCSGGTAVDTGLRVQ